MQKKSNQKRKDPIVAFINSPVGKKALEEAYNKTAAVVAELQKSRVVDMETLLRPFGPADGGRLWPHQRLFW